MPANLTPQYLSAEQRFKAAVTSQEKIEALEEMMAVMPKHKGTEKLQADLRRRLAKLRNQAEKKHGTSKSGSIYSVPKEGAAQIILVGPSNAGKSSLLAKLTNASPEIADYPFTTRLPQPGMMPYENIQLQLVDMPPIDSYFYEPWMGSIVRQADFVLLIVDTGGDELLDEVEEVLKLLGESKIQLAGTSSPEVPDGHVALGTLLVANKSDSLAAADNLAILREFYEERFEILPVSARSGEGLEDLRRMLFQRLDLVRIFTKVPGKKADLAGTPYVFKRGSTVLDAARAVHRDFAETLRFAKIWSSEKSKQSLKYDGQMVERTHRLEDGDVIELHI
jgi:ribosome-interacting GTPase 1